MSPGMAPRARRSPRPSLPLSLEPQHFKMLRSALRATELLPQDDYAWQQVAIANSKLDRDEEAATAGRTAIRLNPQNAIATAGLALVLHELGDPTWKELIVRALELMPSLGENAELAALRDRVKATAKPADP